MHPGSIKFFYVPGTTLLQMVMKDHLQTQVCLHRCTVLSLTGLDHYY